MPTYLYSDGQHRQEVEHGMFDDVPVVCRECGATMHKVPLAPMVNWNGDSSQHPLHPSIKRFIDEAPERRDNYEKEKEQHGRAEASNQSG